MTLNRLNLLAALDATEKQDVVDAAATMNTHYIRVYIIHSYSHHENTHGAYTYRQRRRCSHKLVRIIHTNTRTTHLLTRPHVPSALPCPFPSSPRTPRPEYRAAHPAVYPGWVGHSSLGIVQQALGRT
jgi:hypothetical protein